MHIRLYSHGSRGVLETALLIIPGLRIGMIALHLGGSCKALAVKGLKADYLRSPGMAEICWPWDCPRRAWTG